MAFELVCGICGTTLYAGVDLKSPKEIMRSTAGQCMTCHSTLSLREFTIEITKSPT